jgi:hypothetical protein
VDFVVTRPHVNQRAVHFDQYFQGFSLVDRSDARTSISCALRTGIALPPRTRPTRRWRLLVALPITAKIAPWVFPLSCFGLVALTRRDQVFRAPFQFFEDHIDQPLGFG